MSSLAGESLACGHLGMIGADGQQGDRETSKACTERQLQLARTLRDARGEQGAFLQLGGLAQAAGDHNAASGYYSAALEQAVDTEAADLARVSLGVADGNVEFDSFLQSALSASPR
jgi:hypothetical protein